MSYEYPEAMKFNLFLFNNMATSITFTRDTLKKLNELPYEMKEFYAIDDLEIICGANHFKIFKALESIGIDPDMSQIFDESYGKETTREVIMYLLSCDAESDSYDGVREIYETIAGEILKE